MFKIVITKTVFEKHPAGKEWEKTGHVQTCGCDNCAYTPEIERKVYEQVLENINLEAIILAVNGMPHINCVH